MLVENLGMDGALLIGMCEAFNAGQRLSDATLVFSETESVQVDVVICWELWPRVGVQFEGLTSDAADRIAKFLADSLMPAVLG